MKRYTFCSCPRLTVTGSRRLQVHERKTYLKKYSSSLTSRSLHPIAIESGSEILYA